MTPSSDTQSRVPRSVGSAAEQVAGARDDPNRLTRVLYSSPIPLLIVDGDRRYVHVNAPAQLAFRAKLSEMRKRRIDDLTPAYLLPTMESLWARLVDTGYVTGRYDVANPDGTTLQVVFYALSDVLPDQHVIAFAPEGWSDSELATGTARARARRGELTAREIELLQLAAEGRTGPRIAEELALSPATVKKHFEHIYTKLGVRDRAAAVAKAMRLGLIE